MRALDKPVGVIYSFTNKINSKVYVGQTRQKLNRRVRAHWYTATSRKVDTPFSKALLKYGLDGFSVTVLQECYSIDELNAAERKWITIYKSFGPKGYNATTGGAEFTRSPESREKMSKAKKGIPTSQTHKDAVAKAMKGSGNPFYGKTHDREMIERTKEKLRVLSSGENNASAKLTKEDVSYIRCNPENLSAKELGVKFVVHWSQIYKIRRGKAWKEPCP